MFFKPKRPTDGYFSCWLQGRSGGLAPRTIESYRSTFKTHIQPYAPVFINDLTAHHCAAMIRRQQDAGHTRTAVAVYTVLKLLCREALHDKLLRYDPLENIKRPQHTAKHYQHLHDDQIGAYLRIAEHDRLALAWLLALCCGLRRGELCGLRWSDIDFMHMVMHISNQRVTVDGQTLDTPPKSESGNREIPIPGQLLPLLAIHQQASGYVLQHGGKPYTPFGLDQAHRRMCARAGLPAMTLHGLRHTMATAAISSGVSVKTLQCLLGHASYRVTADTYAHVEDDVKAAAVDSISGHMVSCG